MKKYIIITVVTGLFIFWFKTQGFTGELVWENISRENLDLKSVLVNPDNPGIIYVGSNDGIIIKSEDSGVNWRNILSIRGRNRSVNFLLFDPKDRNSLYAASGNGLFYSFNEGKSWKRIFQGKNYLENECRCIVASSTVIYLGTKAGLFVSQDKGRSWHKEKGKLGKSNILAIAYNKIEPNYIYVASVDGIFRTQDEGRSWERIFAAHPVENGFEQEEAEVRDEEERFSNIRYISCSLDNSNCLYMATSTGARRSCDRGGSWESISNYGLLNSDVKLLLSSAKGNLYAVTKSGIFQYKVNRWQELSFGLASEDIRFLALDNQDNLYAACDKGLFKANLAYSDYGARNPILALHYKDEPKINEVQQAAVKYAEVGGEKIKQWRKQAARKAILPQVSMGVDRNVTDLWHWETGSTTKTDDDILRKGRDGVEWNVSLSWDLSELIWNNDQTSIDVRSRLMVELRDDILDEVTKLYFERIRIKMEVNNLSIEDSRKRGERELKLQELTASLDALTGGYFSSHLP